MSEFDVRFCRHGRRQGTTFVPFVSENGMISWENDGGLKNPAPVNVTGPRGAQGEKGEKGDPGRDGQDGRDGLDGVRLEDVRGELTSAVAETLAGVEETVREMLQKYGEGLTAGDCRHVTIATRTRDSWRPDYGLGGGWDGTAAIETGPYTGAAEISVIVNDTEYDAKNMTQDADNARNGDLIITKTVEE